MTVTSLTEDRTWQIHLDALLHLREQLNSAGSSVSFLPTADVVFNATGRPLAQRTASSWLNATTLELRENALELESLFETKQPPRKLDIRKVHAALLRIRKDVTLLSAVVEDQAVGDDGLAIDQQCLTLIVSTLMVRTTSFLEGKSEEQNLDAHPQLCKRISEITTGIVLSAQRLIQELSSYRSLTTGPAGLIPRALKTVWALASVPWSPAQHAEHIDIALTLLSEIGQKAFIPQAFQWVSVDDI